jgi:integrase
MKPNDLRKAVIASSVLNAGDTSMGTGPYPPFIIAALSAVVPNYSSGNDGLACLVPGYSPPRKDYGTLKRKSCFIQFQDIHLYEAIAEITAIRQSLENDNDWKKHRDRAKQDILDKIAQYKAVLEPNDYTNLDFYGRWIISLIYYYKKMSSLNASVDGVAAVLSEISNLGKIVYDLGDYDCLWILKRLADRYSNPNIVSSMNAFLNFVSVERDGSFIVPNLFLQVKINKLDLVKRPRLKKIITPDMVDRAVDYLLQQSQSSVHADEHLAYTRMIMTELTFYTGFRVADVTDLKLTDVLEDNGILLYVRGGKTKNAERYLHLPPLLPASFLSEFEEYIGYRHSLNTQEDYLFVNSVGKKIDDKSLTDAVREAFKQQGVTDFHYHLLRGAFAGWFLARWAVAFYGHMVPSDAPFRSYEIFSPEAIERFKMLFLGQGGHKEGQESFTYALQILAHLMGHGSSGIALEYYLTVVDWTFKLISSHYELKEVTLTSGQASDLLQVSYPTLPQELKGSKKKTVSPQFIIDEQYKRIGRKLPILAK